MKETLHCQQGIITDALKLIQDVAVLRGMPMTEMPDLNEWFEENYYNLGKTPELVVKYTNKKTDVHYLFFLVRESLMVGDVYTVIEEQLIPEEEARSRHYEVFLPLW